MCDDDRPAPLPEQPALDLGLPEPCVDCDELLPVPALTVVPGAWVTELSTPLGPWYRVEAVDLAAGTITLDAGAGLYVPVRYDEQDGLLLRPSWAPGLLTP